MACYLGSWWWLVGYYPEKQILVPVVRCFLERCYSRYAQFRQVGLRLQKWMVKFYCPLLNLSKGWIQNWFTTIAIQPSAPNWKRRFLQEKKKKNKECLPILLIITFNQSTILKMFKMLLSHFFNWKISRKLKSMYELTMSTSMSDFGE